MVREPLSFFEKLIMIRLIFAGVLLLLSLLTIVKAPTNFFWKLAVGINEFPYIPMLLLIAVTLWGLRAPNYKYILLAMHLTALLLCSLPVLRTYARTSTLDTDLATAFGTGEKEGQLESPYSFFKMFGGIGKGEFLYSTNVYRKTAKKEYTYDFYADQTHSKKAPLIVIIHGGSWKDGDSRQLPALNYYLAHQGYHVAAINYRLAPDYKYPAPLEDLQAVLKDIRKNAGGLHVDMENIVLLGRSAGGQIALQAAYKEKIPGLKGVIAFYAPADMAWGAKIKTNKLVLDADKVMSDYIGGSVREVPEKYEEASAPPYVTKNSVPTLMIHGPIDAMVAYNHSVRLKKKLDEMKVPNYLLDLPTSTHGCDYNLSGPSGQASTYAVERFIAAVTR
jgi:acetyl esterase/lipase